MSQWPRQLGSSTSELFPLQKLRRLGEGREASRRHEERTGHTAAAQPNAPDIPNGTYTASCEGCALVNEQARSPVRAHLCGREP